MELVSSQLTPEEISLFLDYLKTVVRVNLPLDEGLERLAKESGSRRIRSLARDLSVHVQAGSTLVEALRKVPQKIPSLVLALLEAGERSGNMVPMLDYTSRHYRTTLRLTNSFRQALIYPKLVLSFIMLAIIPVSLFAAERASAIYREFEHPPRLTRFFMALSTSFVDHPVAILLFVFFLALMILKPIGPFRKLASWLKIKGPYVGDVYRATLTASFARALGLLLQSGIPLESAVDKLSLDPDNHIVCRSLADLSSRLKDGSRFSEHVGRYPIFPDSFSWLVSLGERGENLDVVLLELASYYEEEARHGGEMAARVVEPASLLVLALIVGPVVLSVFAPMVQLVANIE